MTAVLETARFRLQPISAHDAEHRALYVHLYTNPAVMAQIGSPLAVDAAARAFGRFCASVQGDQPGHRYWMIVDPAEGAIGLAGFHRQGDSAAIGAMLHQDWWRRGVTTEVFTRLLAHGWNEMGLTRVFGDSLVGHAQVVGALFHGLGFTVSPAGQATSGRCRWEKCRPQQPGTHR